MRRDICLYYNKSVPEVFNAYIQGISIAFKKDCTPTPYHTISFGLNFSMKYNMNGGACTLRFVPYNNGTAVNARYSIVQAGFARYKAHYKELTEKVQMILQTMSQEIDIPVDYFLNPANVMCAPTQTFASPQQEITAGNEPMQPIQANTASPLNFCPGCGFKLTSASRFCQSCGQKLTD